MKRISQETELQIIEYYNKGNSMAATGQYFQVSPVTIKNILERYNIPKRTKGGIYKLPDDIIIQQYQLGKSCQEIADNYNVSFHSISSILEAHNIPRDNRYKNTNLIIDYFANIDSYDKAYFLGFLLTDGNVGLNSNAIALSLSSKDDEILKTFAKYTNNENQIYYRKDKPEATLTVKCAQWKNDLSKYGMVPQKTYIADLPILEEKYMPHLMRGLFDGDGWISSKGHQIGFCGAEQMVLHVHEYLLSHLDIYPVKILHPEEHLWQIGWSGIKDIVKLGNYLYDEKNDCYLKRKYSNFLEIQGNTELTN